MAIIQSLLIGNPTLLNKQCISSFIDMGHEFHLYVYENFMIPGIKLMDANEILPKSSIFRYQNGFGKGSVSAFSNLFRYKLLFEKGGWWVDTDVFCLKKFDFTTEYVFASERTKSGEETPASCVIYVPNKSEIMKYCIDEVSKKDLAKIKWREIGPSLLTRAIKRYELDSYLKPYYLFCPVDWWDVPVDMDKINKKHSPFAIHYWNQMFQDSKKRSSLKL